MFLSSSDSPYLVLWHFYVLFIAVVVVWQVLCLLLSRLMQLRLNRLEKRSAKGKS